MRVDPSENMPDTCWYLITLYLWYKVIIIPSAIEQIASYCSEGPLECLNEAIGMYYIWIEGPEIQPLKLVWLL